MFPNPVVAQIFKDRYAAAGAIAVTANAPVLALARKLLAAGHHPDTALEAYRGDVLCLRLKSIGEAAKFMIEENDRRGPRFTRYRPPPME